MDYRFGLVKPDFEFDVSSDGYYRIILELKWGKPLIVEGEETDRYEIDFFPEDIKGLYRRMIRLEKRVSNH